MLSTDEFSNLDKQQKIAVLQEVFGQISATGIWVDFDDLLFLLDRGDLIKEETLQEIYENTQCFITAGVKW